MPIAPKPNTKFKPSMTKAQARKSLTPEDTKALPFLKKKYNNPASPENGMWQEDRLVKYIRDRLQLSDVERRLRVQRQENIDVQMSGFVKHERKDMKADRLNKKGHKPKAIPINLPLVYAQINDAVTYCMSLFAPDTNMFIATSEAKNQSAAEGLTKVVGKHGQKLQYYRQVCKFVQNSIKYNFGGLTCVWENQQGTVFKANTASDGSTSGGVPGQLTQTIGTTWEGNVVKSVDCYNFLYDTSVHPVDLPTRGEYFAEIEALTPFRVRRMNEQKVLFGIERYISEYAPLANTDAGTYYMQPPVVRDALEYQISSLGMINWQQILAPGGPAKESQQSIEIAWFTAWLNANDFDMSSGKGMQCWRIAMANGKYITSAYQLSVTHGQLPVAVSTAIEDDLRNDQRTYAEMLLPLQTFASFLLNTHIDATRKSIYGITVYDANVFPGLDLDTDDLIGARIPMKSSATGIDIDKAFRHYVDAPSTDSNVDMVAKIIELMQKILPTAQAQQVADLERATEYQAAATVQAGSRSQLKIARLINDQALSVIKFQMLYNIYDKMTVISYTDNNGQTVNITPQQLLESELEFDIGTGLKGLDRLQQVAIYKDIMASLLQVKGINEQVDILGLLSYVTEIAGFDSDLSQFKLQPPQQQQPDPNNPNGQQQTTPQQGAVQAGPNGTSTTNQSPPQSGGQT